MATVSAQSHTWPLKGGGVQGRGGGLSAVSVPDRRGDGRAHAAALALWCRSCGWHEAERVGEQARGDRSRAEDAAPEPAGPAALSQFLLVLGRQQQLQCGPASAGRGPGKPVFGGRRPHAAQGAPARREER